MKKLFAFILGGALTASFAFADISVGVSGHGAARVFDYYGWNNDYDNNGAKARVYQYYENADPEDIEFMGVVNVKDGSHSYPATTFGEFVHDFNFSASTEDNKLGFNLDLEYVVDSEDGFGDIVIPDQAKVWWQPTDWFLGQIGMVEVDDLRGTIGDWGNDRRDIGSLGEDDIFDRFYPQAGIALSFYPVEGLFIGATFDAYKEDGNDEYAWAENFYKSINVGFGYTIDDKFQIKAAYFGAKDPRKKNFLGLDVEENPIYEYKDELEDDDFNGKLELGFNWNINENNLLEVGVKVPLWSDNDKRIGSEEGYLFQAVAGVAGENDNFSYKGHAVYRSVNDTDKDDDLAYFPLFGVDAGVEYALDNFTLGATVNYGGAFNNLHEKNISVNTFGAEVYVKKDVAADCFVFAGIADTLTITDVEDTVKNTTNRFYIPLGIEYAF